jgi:hypothetical protein
MFHVVIDKSRQTEIAQFVGVLYLQKNYLKANHNVLWLQVSVDYSFFMQMVDSIERLQKNI